MESLLNVFPLVTFLRDAFESDERRQRKNDEAYLAESVDRYDLEHRMRQLDRTRGEPGLFGTPRR